MSSTQTFAAYLVIAILIIGGTADTVIQWVRLLLKYDADEQAPRPNPPPDAP